MSDILGEVASAASAAASSAGQAAASAATPQVTSTAVPSVGTSVLQGFEGLAKLSADALAKALGLWTAARAAISTVASGVAVAATRTAVQAAESKYQDVQLTPAVLADMVVRNVLQGPGTGNLTPLLSQVNGNTAAQEAALSGMNEDRFAALVLDTGESYGILDALRLYNRGQYMYALTPGPNYENGIPLYEAGENLATTWGITEAELKTVIHYSRVRDQFVPDLLKLARETLPAADAVMLAVKQIVPKELAQSLFEAAGGVGEQFDALVDAAGDSAGVEKAVELAAHGVITQPQLMQIMGLSRLNPRFYYLAEPLAGQPAYTAPLNAKWLPPYEIREAATAGLVSAEQALTWLLEMGYPEDQAKAFAQGIGASATTTAKQETEAMVLKEYQANMLSEAEATTALSQLGYTTASIPFLLQYAQAQQVISARNTAVSRIRQGYLLELLTTDQATTELSQVGVPQAAITVLLADWAAENAVPHTALTTAQIGKLLEDNYISSAEAQSLWRMKGYTSADVQYLLVLYPPPATTTPAVPAGSGGE